MCLNTSELLKQELSHFMLKNITHCVTTV